MDDLELPPYNSMLMVLLQKHIELHDVAVVGFCADGDEASLSMAFTNVWIFEAVWQIGKRIFGKIVYPFGKTEI